tara:strand:+ start:593 stop:901 length:309 start_codon:yes stop_codon:yes gene_type:complete
MDKKQDSRFNVGDLVILRESVEHDKYLFRPRFFPYGKPGLVVNIEVPFLEYIEDYTYTPIVRHYPNYGDEFYWFRQQLVVVLIEGQKWWLFAEELELYIKDE